DTGDAEPRTVLIAGEAGVGKTRLVTEFAGQAGDAGARVLIGGALELGAEGLPYAPFTAALRSLVRELGVDAVGDLVPDVAQLAPCLPELGRPDRTGADATARGPLFEAFLQLVEGLAAQRPLVLVLEDLHWADRSTRELLVFIVRSLRASGVLLIASYRSDDLHRRHPLRPLLAELHRVPRVERIDLERLGRPDVAAQAAGILGHEPEPALVDLLVGRAEGNPLFVEALLTCEDEGSCDISDSLRDLLLRAVERLPDPTQRVLRLASAGGTRVDHRLLAAVATESDDGLAEALRAAVEANVLVADEATFAFRHALIREAVHDELLPGEHTRLHERYAEAIEVDPSLVPIGRRSVEVAYHWYAAHVIDRAVTAAWAAAEEAGSTFAYAEQLSLLERVLALWDRAPDAVSRLPVDHVGLLAAAGEAARIAGDPARAESYATAALSELDAGREPMRAAMLLELRGRSRQQIGHVERFDDLREAARLAEAQPDHQMAARVLAFLAGVEILHSLDEQGRATAERALALSRRIGAEGSAAHALTTLAMCDSFVGDLDGALRRFDESTELAERAGDDETLFRALVDRSDTLMGAGRYDQAIAVSRSGTGRARAAGLDRNHGAFLA
ncbi:MAG: ATP-binding protein, partial [Solirubrobacteraceae bacterium]